MMKASVVLLGLLLLGITISVAQDTQDQKQDEKRTPVAIQNIRQSAAIDRSSVKTVFLANVKGPTEIQELINSMRSILDISHIIGIASQNAIVIRGTPDQLSLAADLIHDFDKAPAPRDTYRVDYTITEMEDGRKLNSRTYSVMCEDHAKGTMKLGSRVPVSSGAPQPGGSATNLTYVDVGMNIDSTIQNRGDGNLTLLSVVEMSSIADSPVPGQASAPLIRQFKTDTQNVVPVGKPTLISTADDVATHRQFQIQVVATKVK